eukprot:jgi/Mesvir1/29736/Mv05709-RA.1
MEDLPARDAISLRAVSTTANEAFKSEFPFLRFLLQAMDDPRLHISQGSLNSGEAYTVRRMLMGARDLLHRLRKEDSSLYAAPYAGALGCDLDLFFRVLNHLFPHVRGAGTTTHVTVGLSQVFSLPSSMAVCQHRSSASQGGEEGLRDVRSMLMSGELVRNDIDPNSQHRKYGYMHVDIPCGDLTPITFFVDSEQRMWAKKHSLWWMAPRLTDTFAMVDADGQVYTMATWTRELDRELGYFHRKPAECISRWSRWGTCVFCRRALKMIYHLEAGFGPGCGKRYHLKKEREPAKLTEVDL